MRTLSRRGFTGLVVRLLTLWTTGVAARSAGDRGLGGTGVVPVDPDDATGLDRGIGGTGVVGTIRGFGSILVNGLKVAYPADVRVTIDGRSGRVGDLRVGQMVRVLAHARGDGLATGAIAVTHEVVGRIERIDRAGFVVLGQRVLTRRSQRGRLRPGDVVAVSGWRQFDGAIVASLVSRVPIGTPARLAGPLEIGADDKPRIGGLAIEARIAHLAGRRVVVTGERIDDAFQASAVTVDAEVPFPAAARLSIEGFVRRAGGEIRFGSGFAVEAGRAGAELDGREMRAVVTAAAVGRGTFAAIGLHRESRSQPSGPAAGTQAPSVGQPVPARQKTVAPSPAPTHPSGTGGKKSGSSR